MPEHDRGWTKIEYPKRLRGSGLTPTQYHVLMTIWTYTNADGQGGHPGMTRLATDTGLDSRTIKKALKALVARGYLVLTAEGGNQYFKHKANEYALSLPRGATDVPLADSARGATDVPLADDDDDHQGGHPVQPRGASSAPRGASSAHEGGHPVPPHQVLTSSPSIKSLHQPALSRAATSDDDRDPVPVGALFDPWARQERSKKKTDPWNPWTDPWEDPQYQDDPEDYGAHHEEDYA